MTKIIVIARTVDPKRLLDRLSLQKSDPTIRSNHRFHHSPLIGQSVPLWCHPKLLSFWTCWLSFPPSDYPLQGNDQSKYQTKDNKVREYRVLSAVCDRMLQGCWFAVGWLIGFDMYTRGLLLIYTIHFYIINHIAYILTIFHILSYSYLNDICFKCTRAFEKSNKSPARNTTHWIT